MSDSSSNSLRTPVPPHIIEQVNDAMHEGFEIPKESLVPEAHLFNDLNLDSLDAIDMMVHIEDRFKIKLDGERLKEVRTLQDIYVLAHEVIQTKQATASS